MKKYILIITLALLPLLGADAKVSLSRQVAFPNNMGVQLKGDNDNEENLDVIQSVGFRWVRRGFIWESMEKDKGVYDFSFYDAFVEHCEARGLNVIACMAFSNKLYGHVKDEPARTAYARWAAALAEHFKGRNVVFEIWNEPNTMTFWGRHGKVGNSAQYAKEYTDLVKAVVPAMKAADPDCILLAGAVSNMWTESYKWMGFCFSNENMLQQDWDVWSVHPYGLKAPEDYLEAYDITRNLMKEAVGKDDTRLWIDSERGFPLGKKEGYAGGDEAKAEEYQSWHVVRQYLIDAYEGLPATIWYEWGGNEGFALYKNKELTPAGKACRVLANQLSGYTLKERLNTESDRDFVFLFTDEKGHDKLVCWAAPPRMESPDKIVEHEISITVPQKRGKVSVADIQGRKHKAKVHAGTLTIVVGGAPQYVTLK